jgi:hypothetical protein
MDVTMNYLDEINKRVKNLSLEKQKEILEILTSWQTGSQREYQRFAMSTEIDVLIGDKVIQTNLRNISASGVFIKTSRKVDVKKDVKVVFSIPGSDKPFKLEGKVVRSDQNGLAVEFKKITPYFKKILDDTIWHYQENIDDTLS